MSGVGEADFSDEPGPETVRAALLRRPDILTSDPETLQALGLALRPDARVVEFGPAALARVSETARREGEARARLEAVARANFAAQAQTREAVIDLLDARAPADLALRLDEIARVRFGLQAGALGLEGSRPPEGWRQLPDGALARLLEDDADLLLGFRPTALGLFGDQAPFIRSMALARLNLPGGPGLMGFGSGDPEGFTPDMGPELVAFMARVTQSLARRLMGA
ncbi:MAG: DUF484 family protein [Phenylobacterium sp.]|uniref:DUF484 family protein n=1 Tax=Phenylobacterium sp. TaxID=1871053 RepID=UPI0025F195F6|nr:DUF484 family protein [Phenylobacterium sp.]MCA6256986.1 DUF484 family protein [Phenylobacterium sp.]MCA6263527.1 DUF484 family protein [Phenylobacterium sp.]MCA6273954.1 DUF484 family protein [Phenylobacterium sp.]